MGKIQPDKRKWRKLTKGEKAIVSKPALAKIIRQQAADIKALRDGLEKLRSRCLAYSMEGFATPRALGDLAADCTHLIASTDPSRVMEEV